MGAADSKEREAEILKVLTPTERQKVHSLYVNIVGNQKCLTDPFLQKSLPKWLGDDIKGSLFHTICNCESNRGASQDNRHVSEIQFAGFLAQLLKGTYTEKSDILYLLSNGKDGTVLLYNLNIVLSSITRCYIIVSKEDNVNKTWKTEIREEHIDRFSRSLLGVKEGEITDTDEQQKDRDELDKWISKCPLFLHIFDRVFNELFPILDGETRQKSFMPVVTNVDWNKTGTILDILSINYINFHLPRTQQTEWRQLFSNVLHGESFAQLVRFICDKGPSTMVVRDKDGHTFGAYVTDSWDIKPHFFGSSDCFLFTLSPHYGVYTTTGYNENYMYLNQGQETMPNGLGLGGQLGYFGLWIASSFNTGHSKAVPKCTTYGSPQLSAKPEFEVDIIEVWGVGPVKNPALDSDEDEYNRTSILDKDQSAKAILEMAGKKQHSEGLRELTEDEGPLTDEMKKKMNTIPKLL